MIYPFMRFSSLSLVCFLILFVFAGCKSTKLTGSDSAKAKKLESAQSVANNTVQPSTGAADIVESDLIDSWEKRSVFSEPFTDEPDVSEPVIMEPVYSELFNSEPDVTGQDISERVVIEPVAKDRVVMKPVIVEPVVKEPVTPNPVVKKTITAKSSESTGALSDVPRLRSRAAFVWSEDSKWVIGQGSKIKKSRERMFDFCHRPHGYPFIIDHLYVSTYLDHPHGSYRYMEQYADDFADFIKDAHKRGFRVEYLSSITGLVNQKEVETTLLELEMILNYNSTRPLDERWDGIHYDIEPHTHSEWEIDENAVWELNRQFFQSARVRVDQYLADYPSDFKIGLAIPTFHGPERLRDVFETMDYVGLMAYNDRAKSVVELSRPILDIAEQYGKDVWIYTESMPASDRWGVAQSNTFADEGYKYLEETLIAIYEEFSPYSVFAGFGYHELHSYRELPENGYTIRDQTSFEGLINSFNQSEHDLWGKVIAYAKPPSSIVSGIVPANEDDYTNHCLRLYYDKLPNSWCGWVTILAVDDKFMDVSKYSTIKFNVRGKIGEEIFTVGLADEKWYHKDDSLQSKEIQFYVPGGITKEWQEVSVPLREFRGADLAKVASIGFHFNSRQKTSGMIFIDDLRFE